MKRQYYFDSEQWEPTVTIDGILYYEQFYPGKEPNLEAMIAYLLDEEVLFIGNSMGSGTTTVYILCNDYFIPAADSQLIPSCDIQRVFENYIVDGFNGVYRYIAEKREVPNQHWRLRNEELMKKVDEKMVQNLNEASKKSTIKVVTNL